MSQNYTLTWRFSGETLQWGGEGGNPSVCSKVVFIKKQPIIAKALFWHLRVLCRGCVCIYSVTSMTTLMLISDRPLTLKITSTHTAGYKFSLLNCSLISWILTNSPPPAHKLLHSKSLFWSLTSLRKPLNTNIWVFTQMSDTSSLQGWQFITNTAVLP